MMASLFKGRIIFTFKNNNKLRMSFRAIFDDAKAKEMGLSLAKRIAIISAIKTATLMASETVKYEISGNNIISDNDVLGTLSNDLSTFTLKEHGQESEMEIVCRLSK